MHRNYILKQCPSCSVWLKEKELRKHIKTHEAPTSSTSDQLLEQHLDGNSEESSDGDNEQTSDDDSEESSDGDSEQHLDGDSEESSDGDNEQHLDGDSEQPSDDAMDLDLQSISSGASMSTSSDDEASESAPPLMLTFDHVPLSNTYMQHMGLNFGEMATKHKLTKRARQDVVNFVNEIITHIRPGKFIHDLY
jgi:Zn-finger nucleic acid-binding protein